jgi:hypothetical protein
MNPRWMCDRISTWLKDAAVENGPIPLGARALATRMRDLGTGCTPAGYKLVRRAPHARKGLALDRNEAQTKRSDTEYLAISSMMLRI